MNEGDRAKMIQIATLLEQAKRKGAAQDSPEGSRYIELSDTLAGMITRLLRKAAAQGRANARGSNGHGSA